MLDIANDTRLAIDVIRIDGETQPRAEVNDEIVNDYAQQMNDGVAFPRVIVFFDGSEYWLADGFHRYHASKLNGNATIDADIREGTQRDAILYSVGANANHGLRRTNADKRRAVGTLLNDPEWVRWSNNTIAKHCAISLDLVNRMRNNLSLNDSLSEDRTYITKHGNFATMNISNIGQRHVETSLSSKFSPDYEQWQKDNASLGLDKFGYSQPATVPFTDETDNEDMWNVDIPHPESEVREVPKIIEYPMKSSTLVVLQSSESNEWFTPSQYVEAARELMGGIDVDPASNILANQVVQATTYYDIDTNGLDKPWHGRVWLNPPYGRDVSGSNQNVWSNRLLVQYKAGITKEAVLLVNANTEAKWFQPLYDYLICLTNHRIRFYTNDGTPNQPTQGNALIYLGPQQERFIQIFRQFGRIVKAVD